MIWAVVAGAVAFWAVGSLFVLGLCAAGGREDEWMEALARVAEDDCPGCPVCEPPALRVLQGGRS